MERRPAWAGRPVNQPLVAFFMRLASFFSFGVLAAAFLTFFFWSWFLLMVHSFSGGGLCCTDRRMVSKPQWAVKPLRRSGSERWTCHCRKGMFPDSYPANTPQPEAA